MRSPPANSMHCAGLHPRYCLVRVIAEVLITLCSSSYMLMMITPAAKIARFLPIPCLLILQAKQDLCCLRMPAACCVPDIILLCGKHVVISRLNSRHGLLVGNKMGPWKGPTFLSASLVAAYPS